MWLMEALLGFSADGVGDHELLQGRKCTSWLAQVIERGVGWAPGSAGMVLSLAYNRLELPASWPWPLLGARVRHKAGLT